MCVSALVCPGRIARLDPIFGRPFEEVCIVLCPHAPFYNVVIPIDLRKFPLPDLGRKELKRGVPIESEPVSYQLARLSFSPYAHTTYLIHRVI